jgi:membrane protein required for colicin V production
MNSLDIVVVSVILLSALFGFTRGLVKEALSIAAWIGAGFAAVYGSYYLIALVILSFISSMVSSRVRQSTLSALDRTLGLVFGLVRGVLLVCLAYIALDWAMPAGGERPTWIEEARTRYLLENGADRLRALVPRAYRDKAVTAIGDTKLTAEQVKEATGAIRALTTPRAVPAAGRERGSAYTPGEQHELDRLIQQQQDSR